MKDTKKVLRLAIYNALTGLTYDSVQVPVSDERTRAGQTADVFVLLGTQQETQVEDNSSTWITKSSIDLEIVNKTGSQVSKDVVDTVYESIMGIIFPTITTIGLSVPADFQFQNGTREMSMTRNIELSSTESVIVCLVKLSFTIVQK